MGQGAVAHADPSWDLPPHPPPMAAAPSARMRFGAAVCTASSTDTVPQCGVLPTESCLQPTWCPVAGGQFRAGEPGEGRDPQGWAACTYLYRDLYILYRERLYRYIYTVP